MTSTPRAALLVVAILLSWVAGVAAEAHATGGSPRSRPVASAGETIAPASSGPSRTLGTSSPAPTRQTPTNATNNKPGLIIGSAVVAVGLVGGGAVAARRRLTDDEHD